MNFPSVSNFSIAKGTGGTNPPEIYVPLWWYSGSTVNTVQTAQAQTFLVKGSSFVSGTGAYSPANLFTFRNPSWSSTQKFALEACIYSASTSGSIHVSLYDWTTNTGTSAIVTGSQISTNATTATVLRSGQFTLTPGHVYWVNVYVDFSSYAGYITDASLIVFPS